MQFPCNQLYPFYFPKRSLREKNYNIQHKELLAIKIAFEQSYHFLEGARLLVQVLMDNKNRSIYRQLDALMNNRSAAPSSLLDLTLW